MILRSGTVWTLLAKFGGLLSVAGGSAGSYETGNATTPEIISTATGHADLRYGEGIIVLTQMYGARGGYGYSVSDKLKFAGSGGDSPLGAGGEFSGDVYCAALPGSGYGAGRVLFWYRRGPVPQPRAVIVPRGLLLFMNIHKEHQ